MKRHALFVGVDQYADKNIPSLSCAVNDATDLQGFFMYGAGYDKVELLRDPAGKKEILSRVSALTADLAPGDFFLFFFAGHGFRVGENHVLVCAGDSYCDVKYGDDGLPLGQLKRRLKGAFDSALFLDACQSDILATRGGEGIAERDIELILEPPKDVGEGDGAMTIVTSCDVGQTAGELAGKGHGLFTCAMLDILGEASRGKTRLEISDSFRIALGKRMNEIARYAGFPTEQRPRFNSTGLVNLVLLDGVPQSAPASAPAVPTAPAKPLSEAPAKPHLGAFGVPSTAKTVKCPICGRRHREDSEDIFECRVCHRDFLCIGHFDEERNVCRDCAGKLAAEEKARAEAERRAQEAARRAREEAARKAREEAERKAREEAERKAREEAECIERGDGRFAGDTRKVEIAPGVEMEFVWVAPGSFRMGSDDGDADDAEKPVHRVTLTKGYWLGKYEVTQAEWRSVMGENPSKFEGDRLPVEQISWGDCQKFVGAVNDRLKAEGEELRVRLPTEAEWEFASRGGTKGKPASSARCAAWRMWEFASRGGTKGKGYKYSGSDDIGKVAWYGGNSGGKTHEVGMKAANELGIHDMSGNVWEWCADWYGGYPSGLVADPRGPASGGHRVFRGGSWYNGARNCRSANRNRYIPGNWDDGLGVRLAASAGQ